ncbi:MAG: LytR/AlgR family response regulator transcription factor [Saprospiraceae bacterium]
MLNYIVLEPDSQQCNAFLDIVGRHFAHAAQLIGTHSNPQSAMPAILAGKPDALFVDQEALTPRFLYFLRQLKPLPLVCATYKNPANLDFLQENPFIVDSLSKPFQEPDCRLAVSRILAFQQYLLSTIGAFQFGESFNPPGLISKVALPTTQGFELENIDDIMYCEGQVNYTKVVTSHKREIILPKTLKFVEAMLPPHLFARVHKSVLVNLNYIKGYYRADGSHIKLLDGTILPVSHRKRDALVNKLVKRPFPSENGHQKMDPDEEPFIERPNTKLS